MKILDSTVIIAFYHEIDSASTLQKVSNTGHEIKIPISVYGEITGETFKKLQTDVDNGVIEIIDNVNQEEFLRIKNRYPGLKNGEIEVIVCGLDCLHKNLNCYCVLDDKKARKVAQESGITFTGTLGLIDFLVTRKQISSEEKETILEDLKSSQFRT